MGTTEDWRSPKYHEQFEGHERPDFAQEFLRRNEEYIRQYDKASLDEDRLAILAQRWGLCKAIDPALTPKQSRALWLEDANPIALRLEGQGPEPEGLIQEHQTRSFRYMLIEDVNGNHHIIWQKSGDEEYRIVIPIKCDTLVKLRAADRFWRYLEGKNSGPFPSPYRLTDQQRKRLASTLRIMDAQKSGASKRKTATILHDEEVSLSEWSDSAERAHMRRLLRKGHYLSKEGYRKLLNPYQLEETK